MNDDCWDRFSRALNAYEQVLTVAKASYCWLRDLSKAQRRQFSRDYQRFVTWRDQMTGIDGKIDSVDGKKTSGGQNEGRGLEAEFRALLPDVIGTGIFRRHANVSLVLEEAGDESWSTPKEATTETRFIVDLAAKLEAVFRPYQSYQWVGNADLENRLRNEVDDCLWDIQETYRVKLSLVEMDDVVEAVIGVARRLSEQRGPVEA